MTTMIRRFRCYRCAGDHCPVVADPAVSDPAGGWSGNDTGGSGAHRGTGPVRGRADRRAFQGPRVCALRPGTPRGRRRLRRSGRCCSHRGRPGLQPAGSAAIFGAFAAHHVDLRCRRATALPDLRGPQGRRPALCPETTVGLSTMRLGKLSDVSARIEPMLTKRRAVDLCRLAGCCCCCSC